MKIRLTICSGNLFVGLDEGWLLAGDGILNVTVTLQVGRQNYCIPNGLQNMIEREQSTLPYVETTLFPFFPESMRPTTGTCFITWHYQGIHVTVAGFIQSMPPSRVCLTTRPGNYQVQALLSDIFQPFCQALVRCPLQPLRCEMHDRSQSCTVFSEHGTKEQGKRKAKEAADVVTWPLAFRCGAGAG